MIFKNEEKEIKYDYAIWGVGYEDRCTEASKSFPAKELVKEWAIGYENFKDEHNTEFSRNHFLERGCQLIETNDLDFSKKIDYIISEIPKSKKTNIIFDISIFSRHRLSIIIHKLIKQLSLESIITIVYSPSEYTPPPSTPTPIRKIGEICDELSGGIGDLSLPTSTILGMGYEKGKAAGILNYLDCSDNYFFIPHGNEEKFNSEIHNQNIDVLKNISIERAIKYELNAPYDTYLNLKTLVLNLAESSRPLIIPLGPKVLAAISVIVAVELNVPVWRVSSDQQEDPINRKSNGELISFSIEIE